MNEKEKRITELHNLVLQFTKQSLRNNPNIRFTRNNLCKRNAGGGINVFIF